VVIFLVMLANGGLFNPETITYQVPELIGKNFESLQPIEGITVIKQGESYSDQYPAGTILDQLPVAGTQVEPGRTVFVTVSLGPKPPDVTMPAVAGKTETEAKEILDALQMDLNIEVKEIYHDTVPEGMVIGADVEVGAVLRKGQKVTLTVSKGVEAEFEVMPNLMRDGIDKIRAESMLAVRGFSNVTWVPVESLLPEGAIVSQSVEPNSYIDITTPIVIEYSSGVRPMVTIEYTFTGLPAMEESYVITIMCGEQIIVQSATIEPGQTTYTVTLTGREPTEYTIYVNLSYYTTVTVNFA
jgi:beta-lactam-binding protein with PASTA domain